MLRLVRFLLVSVMTTAGLAVLLLVAYSFDARGMLDLGPEYRIEFEQEFSADDEAGTDWTRYLEKERAMDDELRRKIDPGSRGTNILDRYSDSSLTHPAKFDGNWNHSFELRAARRTGVAVMLHGLSDSPYSMLHSAQAAVGAGYDVIVPRMPGHGYAVSGLLQVGWEDWTAAVRIAIRRAESLRGPGEPLLLAGYSNGALLALHYALTCLDREDIPCPDRIVMYSPAIAISPAAAFANWHAVLSWMPYFEKLRWLDLLPEIDPFKFTSFPSHSAAEIHKLTKKTHRLLQDPERRSALPPILAFQSVVDNTVTAAAVASVLFDRLPANGSELIIYDVNRNSTVLSLMKTRPPDPLESFRLRAPLNYGLTVLRNGTDDANDIVVARLPAKATEIGFEDTELEWPSGIYSLSHIALPFPPYDRVYGEGRLGGQVSETLGSLVARGEPGLLSLAPAYFLRLRSNPFYAYQAERLNRWLTSGR